MKALPSGAGLRERLIIYLSSWGRYSLLLAMGVLETMRQRILLRKVSSRPVDVGLIRNLGLLPIEEAGLHARIKQAQADRKSTRLNSSHYCATRMPSSACKKKKN